MVLRPSAYPYLWPLEDAPESDVPKAQKIPKLRKERNIVEGMGSLEFHVRTSLLPQQLSKKEKVEGQATLSLSSTANSEEYQDDSVGEA